mmetsp:Transcript_10079/g.21119  ORF Transcript_10079/g.21119 Transcript_10079/m.21119 type:complete len:100 (+) Transcript_10079:85-384(+)
MFAESMEVGTEDVPSPLYEEEAGFVSLLPVIRSGRLVWFGFVAFRSADFQARSQPSHTKKRRIVCPPITTSTSRNTIRIDSALAQILHACCAFQESISL